MNGRSPGDKVSDSHEGFENGLVGGTVSNGVVEVPGVVTGGGCLKTTGGNPGVGSTNSLWSSTPSNVGTPTTRVVPSGPLVSKTTVSPPPFVMVPWLRSNPPSTSAL